MCSRKTTIQMATLSLCTHVMCFVVAAANCVHCKPEPGYLIAHESGQVHWFPPDLFKTSSLLNSNLNANMHSQMLRLFLIRRAAPLNSSIFHSRSLVTGQSLWTKKILDDSDVNTRKVKKEISDLPEKELYPEYTQTDKGVVYDKKPFKYPCIEGKAYVWCSCGRSHKQPFCDGTHKNRHLNITLRPIRWDCTETKDYWFCNCKQTKHPPFCDGTHKQATIQSGHSTIRDVHSPVVVPEKIKSKK